MGLNSKFLLVELGIKDTMVVLLADWTLSQQGLNSTTLLVVQIFANKPFPSIQISQPKKASNDD